MIDKEIMQKVANQLGDNIRFEGLVKKQGRLKKHLAAEYADVLGFDYLVHWNDSCYEFYAANPPLMGCTQAVPVPCPLGVAQFDEYKVDYKRAIELFHTGNWGGSFTSIELFKPIHPEIKEPYWYFVSDLGVQVIIGADTGDFINH